MPKGTGTAQAYKATITNGNLALTFVGLVSADGILRPDDAEDKAQILQRLQAGESVLVHTQDRPKIERLWREANTQERKQ